MKKIAICLDMDDTIFDFSGAYEKLMNTYKTLSEDEKKLLPKECFWKDGTYYPHATPWFFENLQFKPWAHTLVTDLIKDELVDLFFLSAPAYLERSKTEKINCIMKHFGNEMLDNLIITRDKSEFDSEWYERVVLVDDYDHGFGQENFLWDLIHYGPWYDVEDIDALRQHLQEAYGVLQAA